MELKLNQKKFIEDLLSRLTANEPARVAIEYALQEQGMRFYNGAVVPIMNPTFDSEHNTENTGDLTDFENAMMHIGGSFFGDNAGLNPNDTNAIKEQANLLLSMAPKQEWSEEDERKRNHCIAFLNHPDMIIATPTVAKGCKEWLKSLRPQPKNEWNEEDSYMLGQAIKCINNSGKLDVSTEEIEDWLKSLEERVQPQNNIVTDEELAQAKKDAYNNALDKIEYHSGEPSFDDGWSAAIWYLKTRNTQPQNIWKPSDEQMWALSTLANIPESASDTCKKNAQELLEQLKKLK